MCPCLMISALRYNDEIVDRCTVRKLAGQYTLHVLYCPSHVHIDNGSFPSESSWMLLIREESTVAPQIKRSTHRQSSRYCVKNVRFVGIEHMNQGAPANAITEFQTPSARSTRATSCMLSLSSRVRAFTIHVPASRASLIPSSPGDTEADLHNIRAPDIKVSTQESLSSVSSPRVSLLACQAFPTTWIYSRRVRFANGVSPDAYNSRVICRRIR